MYRIGICDDDKIFCSQLEDAVYEIFKNIAADVEVEAWYSGEGLRKTLQKGGKLDLLFLDIEMMEMNGVEVGMFIRDELEDLDTHIVYISAKQNYAMQLFKVQPLDFLVKPVSAEQLQEVISRSLRRRKSEDLYFEYQKASSFCRIAIKDILYFSSMDKKVAIMKKDGPEVFYGKLKVIADQLPDNFIMVHHSYIVNQDHVSEYTYESVCMDNGESISISRPYRKDARQKIIQYMKEKAHNDG